MPAPAKPSDLGTGAARRAADALKNREQRNKSDAAAALDAFKRASGLRKGQGQSTDSNQ